MTGKSNSHRLSPPLAWINRRHLGLSDALIEAVQGGRVAPEIAAAARRHPDWVAYANVTAEETFTDEVDANTASILSPAVRERIDRYGNLRSARFGSPPQPGQIICIDALNLPPGASLPAFLGFPLFVLLDGPSTEAADIWYGWMAAGETEYASRWDLILQASDGAFDPEAGMVQIWNPVWVYRPELGHVVSELSNERLQAVRSLASDFLTEDPSAAQAGCPGRIEHRSLSNGVEVITGSPMGTDEDPRWEYQNILFQAAEAVREPARIALQQRAAQEDDLNEPMWTWLRQLFDKVTSRFPDMVVAPPLAVPMSSPAANLKDEAMTGAVLVWPGRARVSVLPESVPERGRLEVEALEHPLTVQITLDEQIVDRIEITAGEREIFAWEGPATLSLTAQGESRSLRLGPRDSHR